MGKLDCMIGTFKTVKFKLCVWGGGGVWKDLLLQKKVNPLGNHFVWFALNSFRNTSTHTHTQFKFYIIKVHMGSLWYYDWEVAIDVGCDMADRTDVPENVKLLLIKFVLS